MRARAALAGIVVAVSLWPAGAASGGGWDSLEFPRDHYLVGEVATADEMFYAAELEGAGPIDGRAYYAYLLPLSATEDGFGMIDAPTIPEGSIRLGVLETSAPVYVARYDGLYAHASLTFAVPDVPTGDYAIGFCDDPCEHGYVGWLSFARIRIVHTEAEGQLLAELDRLHLEAARTVLDLRHAERDLEGLQAELADVRRDLRLERVGAITPSERIVTVSAAEPVEPGSGPAWWLVLAGTVVAFGAGLVLGVRRRRIAVVIPDPVPEDLETLERAPTGGVR
jgi:hypothetical protein